MQLEHWGTAGHQRSAHPHRPGRPAPPSLTTAMPTEMPRQLCRGCPNGKGTGRQEAPPKRGFHEPMSFSARKSPTLTACVGFAAAWQRCGSSAEQSRPAAQHPEATAPLTACVRDPACTAGRVCQHASHSTHVSLCRQSQAEHGAQPNHSAPWSHQGTGCTDNTQGQRGEDGWRKQGRAAGTKRGRSQHRALESGKRLSQHGAAWKPSEQGGKGCSERRDKRPAWEEP